MPQESLILVEACCGLASVTWRLLAGVRPPVSRIGSKAGYAEAIIPYLKVGKPNSYVLWDADWKLVNALRWAFQDPGAIAETISQRWSSGQPLQEWKRARHEKDGVPDLYQAAAWWVWTSGARGGVGGFKGKHKHRPNVDGFIPKRSSLVQRFSSLSKQENVEVKTLDVATSPGLPSGSVVYVDPPYPGVTGYGHLLSTESLRSAIQKWSRTSRVVISYPHPFWDVGGKYVEISSLRVGQARKSLTREESEWLTIVDC